jgi:hypothetical protein
MESLSGDGRVATNPFEIGKDPTAGGFYTWSLE